MRLTVSRAVLALGLALGATAALPQGTTPMFGGVLDDTNDPLDIRSLVLERTTADGAQIFLFTGSVVAVRGDMEIRANSLRITVPEGGQNSFDRLEATGNVVIVSGTQRASAARAVMDMARQTITMTGNVQLSDGANQMNGETFTVDLATGMWRLEAPDAGRVQTVITPGARN
jgi:lipopolysaccharide export system protein LptA